MTLLRLVDDHDENERDWQLSLHDKQRQAPTGVGLPAGGVPFHHFALNGAGV